MALQTFTQTIFILTAVRVEKLRGRLVRIFAAFDSYAPAQKESVKAESKVSFFLLTVAFHCRKIKNEPKEDELYATAKRQVSVRFRQGLQGLLRQIRVGMRRRGLAEPRKFLEGGPVSSSPPFRV
jgi:hypothetical protein